MRCLVVEDEPDIRSDLARALEAAGFTVDALGDGESAWFQGDVEDYDVAVLDLGLPRLDGLSVLRRWRAAGRAFPVIVVSARGDWTEKVEGIEAGADDVLSGFLDEGLEFARLHVAGVVFYGNPEAHVLGAGANRAEHFHRVGDTSLYAAWGLAVVACPQEGADEIGPR